MKYLLLMWILLAACTPAIPVQENGALPIESVAPTGRTRPAPVIEQNSGPTPSAATVTAVASLIDDTTTSEPAFETVPATATSSPTATSVPSPTPLGPQLVNDIPLTSIVPLPEDTIANVRAIYWRGQELGRDPNAFSKLGDSTILNPHFMGPFDEGDYDLGEFGYLQPTIDRWKGSFERHGVGARHGLHSWTVFDPMWADEKWCQAGEHLLACELRLQNPSVLFVRLGSNDAGSPSGFRFNVKEVIEYAIDNGVIPIIGTKADRFEGSNENNDILRELADEYDVPLWDFDLLAETLPGRGLDTDNIHLIIDEFPFDFSQLDTYTRGHAMQDLTALIALDQIRRVIED